jgi:hypothetical protein
MDAILQTVNSLLATVDGAISWAASGPQIVLVAFGAGAAAAGGLMTLWVVVIGLRERSA